VRSSFVYGDTVEILSPRSLYCGEIGTVVRFTRKRVAVRIDSTEPNIPFPFRKRIYLLPQNLRLLTVEEMNAYFQQWQQNADSDGLFASDSDSDDSEYGSPSDVRDFHDELLSLSVTFLADVEALTRKHFTHVSAKSANDPLSEGG
jgi:hypothetical protein